MTEIMKGNVEEDKKEIGKGIGIGRGNFLNRLHVQCNLCSWFMYDSLKLRCSSRAENNITLPRA